MLVNLNFAFNFGKLFIREILVALFVNFVTNVLEQ